MPIPSPIDFKFVHKAKNRTHTVSDHFPVYDEQTKILTWNMWAQGSKGGFAETAHKAKRQRAYAQAYYLFACLQETGALIAALQEVPFDHESEKSPYWRIFSSTFKQLCKDSQDERMQGFTHALEQPSRLRPSTGNRFSQITIASTAQYRELDRSSLHIQENSLIPETIQQGRVHEWCFVNTRSSGQARIWNVHLSLQPIGTETRKTPIAVRRERLAQELREILDAANHAGAIVVGDTNLDLSQYQSEQPHTISTHPSKVRHQDQTADGAQVDGIFYTQVACDELGLSSSQTARRYHFTESWQTWVPLETQADDMQPSTQPRKAPRTLAGQHTEVYSPPHLTLPTEQELLRILVELRDRYQKITGKLQSPHNAQTEKKYELVRDAIDAININQMDVKDTIKALLSNRDFTQRVKRPGFHYAEERMIKGTLFHPSTGKAVLEAALKKHEKALKKQEKLQVEQRTDPVSAKREH